MKLFVINTNIDSYRIPATKLAISVGLLLVLFFRNSIFAIKAEMLSAIATVLTILLVGPCILVLLFSLVELCYVYQNIAKKHSMQTSINESICVPFTEDQIRSLIEKCDIIEIKLFAANKVHTAGASSDFEHLCGRFFDKRYYIDAREFECIDLFLVELSKYCTNNLYSVQSIDGVDPNNYRM